MEKLQLKDFLNYKFISSLEVSPDKKNVGFVVSVADYDSNSYKSNIWLMDSKSKKYSKLTSLNKERSFVWLDNNTLLFASQRDEKLKDLIESGEAWSAFYTININGGEAEEFMRIPMNVTEIKPIDNENFALTAEFDNNFNVNHISIHDIHDLKKLRGSKYIQSHTNNTYYDTKKLVNQGKHVLYSGTPCQIAGLYSYLGKDYENLITCDLICHGVCSTKVYRHVLNYYEKKNKSKIKNIEFRDKKTGWKDSSVTITFDSGKSLSEIRNISLLTYGFASGFTNNRICSKCKHAVLPRRADITLGDYGGQDYILYPKKEINDGISLVLVNSRKGKSCLENIKDKIYLEEKVLDELLIDQPNIYKSNELNIIRDKFFDEYINNPFEIIKKEYLQAPFKTKLLYKIGVERYKSFKKIIKRLSHFN